MSEIWHPVRHAILRRAADGAATLPELAEAAGVHLNTARAHVAALEAGGALTTYPVADDIRREAGFTDAEIDSVRSLVPSD